VRRNPRHRPRPPDTPRSGGDARRQAAPRLVDRLRRHGAVANIHRDPKRSRRLNPSDFDPFAKRQRPIRVGVSVLKDVFIDGKMPQEAHG